MLTVIIDARRDVRGLPPLLAQLTAGAVDGLVRQVQIVADVAPPIGEICEETGAEAHPTLEAGAAAARAERLLILPAGFRLRDGWMGAIEAHVRGGRDEPAVIHGLGVASLFGRRPFGLLVERSRLQGRRGADLQRLRRELGLRVRRIG